MCTFEQGTYSKNKFQHDSVAQQNRSEGSSDDWEEEHSQFTGSKVAQTLSRSNDEQTNANLSDRYQPSLSQFPQRPVAKIAAARPSTSTGRWNPIYKRKLDPWEEEFLRSRSNFFTSPASNTAQATPKVLQQQRLAKQPQPQTRVAIAKRERKSRDTCGPRMTLIQ